MSEKHRRTIVYSKEDCRVMQSMRSSQKTQSTGQTALQRTGCILSQKYDITFTEVLIQHMTRISHNFITANSKKPSTMNTTQQLWSIFCELGPMTGQSAHPKIYPAIYNENASKIQYTFASTHYSAYTKTRRYKF